MRVQFKTIAGSRTRVLHEGGGAPVLLLHGLGTTAERWLENIDPLGAAGFAAYAPDLLGAGFSDDAPFTQVPPLVHAKHLRALVDALGFDRYFAVGSSYGALLAALLALHAPERVRALVIVGSGSALHPPEEQANVLKAARENALRALRDGTLEGARQRMERIVHRKETIPAVAPLVQLIASALPGRVATSERWYEGMLDALAVPESQVWHRLEEIRVPTLIITGRNDIRASVEWAQKAQQRIPDCRLEIFDECGHGAMFEHAGRFNALVTEFLRRHA